MFDPISPPAARRPEEALELVSAALSDGDLEAALAQYEREAVLQPWAAGAGLNDGSVRSALAYLMALRLPLSVTVQTVLAAGDLALVLGEREIAGAGLAGDRIQFSGRGSSLVRRQPDGTWCVVAEAWCLIPFTSSPHGSPTAPGEPPSAGDEPGIPTRHRRGDFAQPDFPKGSDDER
jgi:ketosteroid isomerase-like protein